MKDPQGKLLDTLLLFRRGKGDYRWIFPADGAEFDGVAYLAEEDAIRALRVKVEGDPQFVGYDLTLYAVEPTPDLRAARRIVKLDQTPREQLWLSEEEVAEIIQSETNITALLDAYQTLLAFVFQRRMAYAKALFPAVDGQEPRDLSLDGLLLECIEATEKATGQSYDNLRQILKQPVSKIISARGQIKKGTVQ